MKTTTASAIVLASLLLLSGCATAVFVGGGRGGEAAAQRMSDSDAQIVGQINRRLVNDATLPALDINVESHDGVVTLSGKVPTREAAQKAEALARSVTGVKSVRNTLRVGR